MNTIFRRNFSSEVDRSTFTPDVSRVIEIDPRKIESLKQIVSSNEYLDAKDKHLRRCWDEKFPKMKGFEVGQIEKICNKGRRFAEWRTEVLAEYAITANIPYWAQDEMTKEKIQEIQESSRKLGQINRTHAERSSRLSKFKTLKQTIIDKTREFELGKELNTTEKIINWFPFTELPAKYLVASVNFQAIDETKSDEVKASEGHNYVSPQVYDTYLLNMFKSEFYEACVKCNTPVKEWLATQEVDFVIPDQTSGEDHSSGIVMWEKSESLV